MACLDNCPHGQSLRSNRDQNLRSIEGAGDVANDEKDDGDELGYSCVEFALPIWLNFQEQS